MTDTRGFDWGPPAKSSDGLKDYLIYLIIVIALGFGIWILFNIREDKASKVYRSVVKQELTKPLQSATQTSAKGPSIEPLVGYNDAKPLHSNAQRAKASGKAPDLEIVFSEKLEFYVQLGAFEDEASASEIYNFLKENDFNPILKAPNEQLEVYRVVVGPFTSEADADYRAEKLNELGLPCFVVEY